MLRYLVRQAAAPAATQEYDSVAIDPLTTLAMVSVPTDNVYVPWLEWDAAKRTAVPNTLRTQGWQYTQNRV